MPLKTQKWFRLFALNGQEEIKFALFLSRTYYSSGGEFNSSGEDNNTDDEHEDSDMEVDSVGTCSCSDINELQSYDDSVDADDLFTVYVGVEEADPVCVKFQDLFRCGKLSRERIFYKYLKDVLEIMYNPFHEYDHEVVEFFNTITYLGSKRTTHTA